MGAPSQVRGSSRQASRSGFDMLRQNLQCVRFLRAGRMGRHTVAVMGLSLLTACILSLPMRVESFAILTNGGAVAHHHHHDQCTTSQQVSPRRTDGSLLSTTCCMLNEGRISINYPYLSCSFTRGISSSSSSTSFGASSSISDSIGGSISDSISSSRDSSRAPFNLSAGTINSHLSTDARRRGASTLTRPSQTRRPATKKLCLSLSPSSPPSPSLLPSSSPSTPNRGTCTDIFQCINTKYCTTLILIVK